MKYTDEIIEKIDDLIYEINNNDVVFMKSEDFNLLNEDETFNQKIYIGGGCYTLNVDNNWLTTVYVF